MTNKGDAIRFLLEHGAEANVYDHDNKSPLEWAVDQEEVREVGLLLDHGAKVDPVNKFGDTPLVSCLESHDRPDIVKLLIQYGADVAHRNKAGDTALSLALKWNYKVSIGLLKAAGAGQ